MKTNTCVSIEPELLEKARSLKIGISKTLSDTLKTIISMKENDLGAVNIELELKKKDQILKKLAENQGFLAKIQENIDKFKEIEEQKKAQDLQKEKERIESLVKCLNCGSYLDDKKQQHTFNKGNVCHACFMAADQKNINKWNGLNTQ